MDTVEERAAALGAYIIEHNATVREAAKRFGISKSTVHKDVTYRLRRASGTYAEEWLRVRNTEKNLYNPVCLLYN